MPIRQLDSEGKLIAEFENAYQAMKHTGVSDTNISKVLKGLRLSAGGFKWIAFEGGVEVIPDNIGTVFHEDLENGTLKVDTYYDHPPHPDEVIKDHKIDSKKWKLSNFYSKGRGKGWLVTAQFLNLQTLSNHIDLTEDRIEDVFERYKEHKVNLNDYVPDSVNNAKALRIIITDCHIGMKIDNGFYGGKWDKDELERRRKIIVAEVLELANLYNGFEEIHFIDLGDLADGLNATTTRGSHTLPQNMNNTDTFDVAVDFKTKLVLDVAALVKCEAIRVFNVTNDNHSGAFAYFIGVTSAKILELSGEKIKEVRNIRKFMDHYIFGNHVFILTHGKDEEYMKNGFDTYLDKNAKEKIDNYISHHKLKQDFITVEKGDRHLQVYDHSNSEHYELNTYRALSPSSAWVQTNFKKGTSGFTLQVVEKDRNKKTTTPIYFDWVI